MGVRSPKTQIEFCGLIFKVTQCTGSALSLITRVLRNAPQTPTIQDSTIISTWGHLHSDLSAGERNSAARSALDTDRERVWYHSREVAHRQENDRKPNKSNPCSCKHSVTEDSLMQALEARIRMRTDAMQHAKAPA